MQKVAPDFAVHRHEAALDAPISGGRPSVSPRPIPTGVSGVRPTVLDGGFRLSRRIVAALARATDGQLALLIGAVLFVVGAWPLALADVPPLQDLPNHLAATTVILHPERYPEFVFNGFFKTNSVLFTWLLLVGRLVGVNAAARLFVLIVLALGAVAFPRFALSFGGRRRMIVAAFFQWPMVHHWFVSMGMLDFAMGVPLATLLLVLLNDQRRTPTWPRGVVIALLAVLTWHAHVFPLLVVHLLMAVHIVTRGTWRERGAQAVALLSPLLPSTALVLKSLWVHFTEPVGAMTGYVSLGRMLPPWELFYNLWAEWFYGFTWLEIATLVPCLGMGLWALYRWRDEVPFFGPVAFAVLGAFYVFTPYVATNWFHVNSRFIPFIWLAMTVRLPERLPTRALGVLGVCAASYTVGMGVDYVRLERDLDRFTAGLSVVPEGSKLLPLVFRSKATSQNTRSLLHAWGFYVVQKLTSAPLLFAHSRSFPVVYREPPPVQFNHLVLEGFAPAMGSPDWVCDQLRSQGVATADCGAAWRARWAEFWSQAEPRFDHVLMWSAPREVLPFVPAAYRVVFQKDELTVLERDQRSVVSSQ
jgi:hypothetical protein